MKAKFFSRRAEEKIELDVPGLKPHRQVKTLTKIRSSRSSTKPYQSELFETVNRIDKTLLDTLGEE